MASSIFVVREKRRFVDFFLYIMRANKNKGANKTPAPRRHRRYTVPG
jgi:hypothetical protein